MAASAPPRPPTKARLSGGHWASSSMAGRAWRAQNVSTDGLAAVQDGGGICNSWRVNHVKDAMLIGAESQLAAVSRPLLRGASLGSTKFPLEPGGATSIATFANELPKGELIGATHWKGRLTPARGLFSKPAKARNHACGYPPKCVDAENVNYWHVKSSWRGVTMPSCAKELLASLQRTPLSIFERGRSEQIWEGRSHHGT